MLGSAARRHVQHLITGNAENSGLKLFHPGLDTASLQVRTLPLDLTLSISVVSRSISPGHIPGSTAGQKPGSIQIDLVLPLQGAK